MTTDTAFDAKLRSSALLELAQQLQTQYAFEEMGAQLAARVRELEATNAYSSESDRSAFAQALTRDLQSLSLDKHLRVFVQRVPPRREPDPPRAPGDWINGAALEQVRVLEGNIGLLRMAAVPPIEQARAAVAEAFASLQHTDALVLDCRNNHGGDPRTVAWYVSHLMAGPAFVINSFHSRDGRIEEFATTELGERSYGETKPVIVLTSRETFSGGEELAYDLQAMQRALLVGEVTGGGANPANTVAIGAQLQAQIPFAHPVNPFTNTNWEGVGVVPDVAVSEAEALDVALEALRRRLAGESDAAAPKRTPLPPRRAPR